MEAELENAVACQAWGSIDETVSRKIGERQVFIDETVSSKNRGETSLYRWDSFQKKRGETSLLIVDTVTLFKKIIAFLPNYSEEKKDELKNLKIPVLVIWILQD